MAAEDGFRVAHRCGGFHLGCDGYFPLQKTSIPVYSGVLMEVPSREAGMN